MIRLNVSIIKSYKTVLGYIGVLLIIIGLILLLPTITIIFYQEDMKYLYCFVIPAFIAIFIGWLLSKNIKDKRNIQLTHRQDAVIVTITWLLAATFSAFPFILSGQLNFTQAFFEAVSGWTTTGLSVVDVTLTPKIYLLFRSIMQFFGGVGLVLVMLSALSGTYGMRLYNAEGHSDYLLPNLAKSARIILSIYLGYTVAGVLLYVIFGMPLFDAVNHSIGSLSTGGFSTMKDSIGAYHSFPIELITIILMLLGTTNFAAHLLLIKGKFKTFGKIGEVQFMLVLLGILIPAIAFLSLNGVYSDLPRSLRISLFELTSALTTTGYSTVTYNEWKPLAILVMILLMLIGGGSGSTAGGIKVTRIHLLTKSFYWNIKKMLMPNNRIVQNYVLRPEGKVYIEDNHVSEASYYVFSYLIFYFIGVSILTYYGYSLQDSLFEFASAIGTVGLSVGITAANASPVVLWTETFGMILGRLEIYVVLITFIKITTDFSNIVEKKHDP